MKIHLFVLALALLFAPVLFGLELIQNAPDLEFSFEVMNGDRPEIIIFDYAGSLRNLAVPYNYLTISAEGRISETLVNNLDPTEDPIIILEAGNREGVGKVLL